MLHRIAAAVTVVAAAAAPAPAQNLPRLLESSTIHPPEGLVGISDLSRHDDVMVIGLAALGPHEDAGAYAWERGPGGVWSLAAELVAGDLPAQFNGFFGRSVDVDSGVIAVGADAADGAGPSQGAVYVFERVSGAWTLVQKVLAPAGATSVSFGRDVSLEGPRLVVGDPDAPGGGTIHVFERTAGTFLHQASISPPAGGGAQGFGTAVALAGDRVAVGAPGTNSGAIGAGAVFVVEKAGGAWTVVASLAMAGPPSFAELGASVALDGDVLVAGAPSKALVGRVVVYERTGGSWAETQQLVKSAAAAPGTRFGGEVAIAGDVVAVNGATGEGDPELFVRTSSGWLELCRVHAKGSDATGRAIDLEGSSLMTGAYEPGFGSSAYVAEFDLSFLPHGNGCLGSTLAGPRLKASGDPAPGGLVTFSVKNGTSNAPALLFLGAEPGTHPAGFGCALLVSPLPPLALPFSLGPVGAAVLSGTIPLATPPTSVTVQAWLTDPLLASGFSATGAIWFSID